VPGIGPVTAKRILDARRNGSAWNLRDLGVKGKRLALTARYAVMT